MTLSSERSHYVCRVMRHVHADHIVCFDGQGGEFECEITQANSKACEIVVRHEILRHPAPRYQLHLALALLKGQAMDRALQQAAELGASTVRLLDSQRSNVRLADERLANKLEHWRKVLASSTEQCGSGFVPTLHPPAPLDQVLDAAAAAPMAFHPDGAPMPSRLDAQDRLLFIGPEGGWDASELRFFEDRDVPCHAIGNLTFRAETAPSVTLALVRQAQDTW